MADTVEVAPPAAVPATIVPSALVRPVADLSELQETFAAYAAMCDSLLTDDDYMLTRGKRYRVKSAWRKLAIAFGVSGELISRDWERDDEGRITRAEVVVRATAPNGRVMDGLGACDMTERCDARCVNCDGRRHYSHPGHDVPATAFTRAVNRAFSDLFGFGEVSFEEVSHAAISTAPPPHGWSTQAECDEEHAAMAARIRAIPAEIDRTALRRWRERYGWPVSAAQLEDFGDLVWRHEIGKVPAPPPASPEAAQMRGREAVSPPAPVDQQLVSVDSVDLEACRALTETLQRELNDARKAALLPPLTAEMSVDELTAWQQLYRPVVAHAENDLRQVLAVRCKEVGQDDNERHRWVRTVTGRQGLRDCGLADLHKLEIWTKETA